MTPAAELAASYAAGGQHVLPVRDKRPLIAGGVRSASADATTIAQWWQRWPDAEVAIATGRGLVVIDVDTRHGGSIDPSWPSTMTATTPSGGWHLFYATTEAIPCSVGRLAPGVDVRGEGGYVVAPGQPGRELADDREPVELPQQMAAILLGQRRPRNWRPYDPTRRLGEGERNDGLARLAGYLLHAELADEATLPRELCDYNRVLCIPPLDEDEVRGIAVSIARKHARESA